MPAVSKQQPVKPVVKAAPGEPRSLGLKLLTYGRGKTGKTRLFCTFPKRCLLIGTEDGTKSICTSRKKRGAIDGNDLYALYVGQKEIQVDFIRLKASNDFVSILQHVQENSEYLSAGLDTGGGVQDLILKEVLNLNEIPVQKSWGITDRATWGIIGQQFKERCRTLLGLVEKLGVNVNIIAHERNFKDEDTQASDLIYPTVGAALTPSVAGWLNAECDYICQTFIREQMEETVLQIGDTTQTIRQGNGKMEYCLRVGPHPTFVTGFRLPPGVPELPDAIANPSFDKIIALIEGKKI